MDKARNLFDQLCEQMAALLSNSVECPKCKRSSITAAELNVIRQLLKDNNISFLPESDPKGSLNELLDSVPEFMPDSFD